ncbi:hypothetical protein CVD25_01040 [Bacillus canaveralius]|uniref:Uncharacterized protein n=1 Tax=Bacillus canaveralius TaxID=1403243 RepID=A0A2N5GPL6_9BACI|nr:hypothetical protein [Bacillus canaveralius]PLR84650.1 hypothetical protein CU635_06150 [Bacillus canaveralius]PLS00802.1 hypothetical protein CVD25_01040 [Bacillus canaveralius]
MDIQEMLDRVEPGEILAAKDESAAWEDFEVMAFGKRGSTEDKLNDIRIYGYKIFIVPSEKKIYDDIAGVVQEFTAEGRGKVLTNLGDPDV